MARSRFVFKNESSHGMHGEFCVINMKYCPTNSLNVRSMAIALSISKFIYKYLYKDKMHASTWTYHVQLRKKWNDPPACPRFKLKSFCRLSIFLVTTRLKKLLHLNTIQNDTPLTFLNVRPASIIAIYRSSQMPMYMGGRDRRPPKNIPRWYTAHVLD